MWAGKSEAIRAVQIPSKGTLEPVPEAFMNFDESQNLIIEGDTLEVLKLLQKSYYGEVKIRNRRAPLRVQRRSVPPRGRFLWRCFWLPPAVTLNTRTPLGTVVHIEDQMYNPTATVRAEDRSTAKHSLPFFIAHGLVPPGKETDATQLRTIRDQLLALPARVLPRDER